MSEKFTDEQIIEAFRWHNGDASDRCRNCPFEYTAFCDEVLGNAVLDLINRQRAEVEKYKTYYETMETELDSFRKDQAEVKFLKNRIRAEAVKEFAERLKKDFYDLEFNADTERKTVRVSELREQMDWVLHTVSIEIINDLAKEMAGDQSRDK